jgi:hypothetical protein
LSEPFQILKAKSLPDPGLEDLTPSATSYDLEESREYLRNRFQAIANWIRQLPPGACPDGYVVLEVVLHPQRLRSVDFPDHFLRYLNLTVLRRRTIKHRPRKEFDPKPDQPDPDADFFSSSPHVGPGQTFSLYVVGRQKDLEVVDRKIQDIQPNTPISREMTFLETINSLKQADCIKLSRDTQNDSFEVTLQRLSSAGENFPLAQFCAYAQTAGFTVALEYHHKFEDLFIIPVNGSRLRLPHLAQFVFVRQIIEVGRLRSLETPVENIDSESPKAGEDKEGDRSK